MNDPIPSWRRALLHPLIPASLVGVMAGLYAAAGWAGPGPQSPEGWFGFNQWTRTPSGLAIAAASLTALGTLWLWRFPERGRCWIERLTETLYRRRLFGVAVIGVAMAAFWLMRSNHLNADGRGLLSAIQEYDAGGQMSLTHDEMLEFYFHYRFGGWARRHWGVTAQTTCQIQSVLCGGVFLILLALYGRLLCGGRALVFVALVVTGGYAQLFFGDVENYTLTATLGMAYWLLAALHLRDRAPLAWVVGVWALAVCSHLLALFFAPAVIWLFWRLIRQGRWAESLIAGFFALAIFALVVIALHFTHLPLSAFRETHAFHASRNLYFPSWKTMWEQTQLLALLFPGWLFMVAVVLRSGWGRDDTDRHLFIGLAAMALYLYGWRPALGVLDDWNLYAVGALPASLWTWRYWVSEDSAHKPATLFAVGGMAALHTAGWIIGHHGAC